MDSEPSQPSAVTLHRLGTCGDRRRLSVLYLQLSGSLCQCRCHHAGLGGADADRLVAQDEEAVYRIGASLRPEPSQPGD